MSKTPFNRDCAQAQGLEMLGRQWPYALHILETTPSTNGYLMELEHGAEHGTLVVACRQIAGRGRFGRPWFSDENSIAFSLQLDFPSDVSHLTLIPPMVAVAVLEACQKWGIHVQVKWPNDITDRDGRKLCGVLTELRTQGGVSRGLVVGVGLNVNQTNFPPEVDRIACSLRMLTPEGALISREDVILAIARGILNGYSELVQGGGASMVERWKSSCGMFGHRYRDKRTGEVFTPLDMDIDGALVVKRSDGSMDKISSGEVIEVAHSY